MIPLVRLIFNIFKIFNILKTTVEFEIEFLSFHNKKIIMWTFHNDITFRVIFYSQPMTGLFLLFNVSNFP